eukprot:7414139-Alexandrium_andersonii.AAC.1
MRSTLAQLAEMRPAPAPEPIPPHVELEQLEHTIDATQFEWEATRADIAKCTQRLQELQLQEQQMAQTLQNAKLRRNVLRAEMAEALRMMAQGTPQSLRPAAAMAMPLAPPSVAQPTPPA